MIHLKSNGVDYAKSINILGSRIYLIAPIAPVLSEKKHNFCSLQKSIWPPNKLKFDRSGGGGGMPLWLRPCILRQKLKLSIDIKNSIFWRVLTGGFQN